MIRVRTILAMALLFSAVSSSQARLVQFFSYQDLYDRADIVAIGVATSSIDTAETIVLPDIHPDVHVVGVSTQFRLGGILKGSRDLKRCTLHHYRLAVHDAELNGPGLVSFDPKKPSDYLLFLNIEQDGRYKPVAGQTDANRSVIKLSGGLGILPSD